MGLTGPMIGPFGLKMQLFSYPSLKRVLVAQKNYLIETVLLSNHNIIIRLLCRCAAVPVHEAYIVPTTYVLIEK